MNRLPVPDQNETATPGAGQSTDEPSPADTAQSSSLLLSSEDLDRARDRRRVQSARAARRSGLLVWLLLGPGVLAMLGENDGPSMLSYAATGATYGIGFFVPFIVATFAAAFIVQEMAMRVGAVTHRGYGELIFQRFGAFWGWFSAIDLVITNLITLITEVVAIRVGAAFFGISSVVAVAFAIGLVVLSTLDSRYARWERLTMGLALFNLVFVPVAILSHPDPGAIAGALLTWTPWPGGSWQALLLILASNIGATVTPWMLFFQQSSSVDKGLTPRDIGFGRLDTLVGTVLAAAVACAAVIATAPLFTHHVDLSHNQAGAGYAEALKPLIGNWGASLFALGLVEAGAVAMLTISASTAYAVGEVAGGAGHSFNRSLKEAPMFHAANIGMAVIAGVLVLLPGMPLLAISLNANLLATVLMPPALVFLLVLANDREIMGNNVNARLTNVLAIAVAVAVALAGSASAIVSFVQSLPGQAH